MLIGIFKFFLEMDQSALSIVKLGQVGEGLLYVNH